MSSQQTADEMFLSLNGFDEIAIAKSFGSQLHTLHPEAGGSPFLYLRALAFVDLRRQDVSDRDAYKRAMELSVSDANDYFADADPELDPDDPDTEAGKGSLPSA